MFSQAVWEDQEHKQKMNKISYRISFGNIYLRALVSLTRGAQTQSSLGTPALDPLTESTNYF